MSKTVLTFVTAAGLLAGSAAIGLAQNSAKQNAPGIQMQDKGSVSGTTGASGYAPGTQMRAKGSVEGTTGASGYAPGRVTTGAGVKGGGNIKAHGNSGKK